MITETGKIMEGEKTIGQIQVVESDSGKRVQLYNSQGIYLCDCPFEGDNDTGYAIGMGMAKAYQAAWRSAQAFFTYQVQDAMRQSAMTELS